MDLQPSDLQELLRSTAQDFLAREVPSSRVREIQEAGEPDAELWKQIVELGWTGLPIAEEHGGQGASLIDLAVVIEQICRSALLSPFQQTMLAALVIQQHGDDATRAALLPRIASDGVTVTAALLEGVGELSGPIDVTYDGDAVRGEKRFVEYARSIDYHLVAAHRDGAEGLAVVPAGQDGVRIVQDLASIGKTPQAVVSYEGARVEHWIEGAEAIDTLRHLGSAIASLEACAYAQQALDMTVEYVQLRVQFGRPIGSFQAVQVRCAEMATHVQAARFLTMELLWNLSDGTVDPDQIAIVKAVTAKTLGFVAQESHLLHGGIGYMTEYDLYFNTIRGKEAALRFGGAREAMERVAAALLD